ncbi:hypothetical protein [Nesterenkonia sp. NBAIMH1]|uniref:hypothetical protein n=1 Tax=Nesterenkonia sp. NBAIMH1 TaxID=2600320 RepID=UPI0011B6DB6F|nr:hypothetical protein [Nesterenkonia sp. NBAIMH1]
MEQPRYEDMPADYQEAFFRDYHDHPEFGRTRREPLRAEDVPDFRAGRLRIDALSSQWVNEVCIHRQQTGVRSQPDDAAAEHPPRTERSAFLLDGREWIRTHRRFPAADDPNRRCLDQRGRPTTTDESVEVTDTALPINGKWDLRRGPNPVEDESADQQSQRARETLREADARLRRRTVLSRWSRRLSGAALVLAGLALLQGPAGSSELGAVGLVMTVLLLPAYGGLRWLSTLRVRRVCAQMLAAGSEEHRAAVFLNKEAVEQWKAGGPPYWLFAPALPPAGLRAWRRDPRRVFIGIGVAAAPLLIILLSVAAVLWWETLAGEAAGDPPWVLTVAVLVVAAIGVLGLRMRSASQHDHSQLRDVVEGLRFDSTAAGPRRPSPWSAPARYEPVEDPHQHVMSYYRHPGSRGVSAGTLYLPWDPLAPRVPATTSPD